MADGKVASALPPISELLACPCLRLRQVSRKVSQVYDRALEPVSLTSPQFSLLVHLHAKPGLTMKALADIMVMDPTTLKRLLDPMVRRGLAETKIAKSDARSKQIFMADAGQALLEAAVVHWRVAIATVNEKLGAAEVAALSSRLVRILNSLAPRS